MSLYNALFGENPFSLVLLEALGVTQYAVPRYRDCYLNADGSEIIIHTRTGGGNREAHEEGNKFLTQVPGYKYDEDDSFDSTYASFHYAVPEEFKPLVGPLKDLGAVSNPAERWQQLLSDLQKGDTSKPEAKRALAVGERIMKQIEDAEKSGESGKPGKIIEI
jgi:hypothetical protein